MRRVFTIFIVLMLTSSAVLMAGGRKNFDRDLRIPRIQKVVKNRMMLPRAEKFRNFTPPENPVPRGPRAFVPTLDRTTTFNYYHMQVDSSRNGYGWLDASIRTLARYNDVDSWGSENVEDYMVLAYRQFLASDENTGIIGSAFINLENGLQGSTPTIYENLNQDLNGASSGGRYPSIVVSDYPIIIWNQYLDSGGSLANPPESYIYESPNYDGYNNPGYFDVPIQLDAGYTDPLNGSSATDKNRHWQQSTAIAQPDVSTEDYHLISMMDTWVSDGEKSFFGEDHRKNALYANTDDPYEWTTNVWHPWDPQTENWTMLNNAVDMNKNGLAAIVGAGELEYHPSDSGWFYDEMKITYMTSTNYGNSWSDVDTIHFADFFPLYVYKEDSLILYWQIIGPDTVLTSYEGPTFSGMESDIDVVVGENDTIYVGFQKLWGRPSDGGWYPNGNFTGFYVAMTGDRGDTWEMSPIAANVGFYEGDDDPPEGSELTMNFFGPEIDLGFDEAGNLYAGWLDRPRKNPQLAPCGRYAAVNDGAVKDYVTDVFVSRTTNNGASWSWPLNATETPSIDEYEFKMAKAVSSAENGTVYFGYNIAATDRLLASGANSGSMPDMTRDAYVDMVNYIWVGYGNDIRNVSGIGGEKSVHTAKTFALEQNYPNPFNPETQIEFTASAATHASVDVYSLTGEKVATVFNGQARSGLNKVRFNGSNLAAGIYFYRLTMDGKSAVRKMVLVK